MDETAFLKYLIENLRTYLNKNSINEISAKQLEGILTSNFTFITNLTFKMQIDKFYRVTVNSRVCDGKEDTIQDIDKLKYRKDGATKNGRANLIGEKILYGTDDINTALKEARVKKNDLITVSTWKLTSNKPLNITPIFKNFPKKSDTINVDFLKFHLDYRNTIKKLYNKYEQERIDLFVQFLADCFTKDVDENNHFDYFLSSFYANRLFNFLDNGSIEAILYPSMRNDLITTNIAMKHNIFDNNYELEKVEEKIVLTSPRELDSHCDLDFKKISKQFQDDKIIW